MNICQQFADFKIKAIHAVGNSFCLCMKCKDTFLYSVHCIVYSVHYTLYNVQYCTYMHICYFYMLHTCIVIYEFELSSDKVVGKLSTVKGDII